MKQIAHNMYKYMHGQGTELTALKPHCLRWRFSGEMSEARQGAAVLLVGGKPTVFGGFNNYDAYPTLVEQFDPKLGTIIRIQIQGVH